MPVIESIHLQFREGTSDKEYQASMEQVDGGYVVNFAYGRRGATLKADTKTKNGPISLLAARKIYDGIVAEKIGKGYQAVAAGQNYVAAPKDEVRSGFTVQLLNPIGDEAAKDLNHDPAWVAQEKFDGKRFVLEKVGDAVKGINRRGLYIGFPVPMETAAKAIPVDFMIDGEAMGDTLRAFDLLQLDGRDLRQVPYSKRMEALTKLLESFPSSALVAIPTARTAEEKTALYEDLRAREREGIVYKRAAAPYSPGRANSGGDQLKRKFWESCSAIVEATNDQRSVRIALKDETGVVRSVGNCTIPANHGVPKVGDVVEVRYLYAYQGGALAQPIYLGVRADIARDECTMSQLKYKSEDEAGLNPAPLQGGGR